MTDTLIAAMRLLIFNMNMVGYEHEVAVEDLYLIQGVLLKSMFFTLYQILRYHSGYHTTDHGWVGYNEACLVRSDAYAKHSVCFP